VAKRWVFPSWIFALLWVHAFSSQALFSQGPITIAAAAANDDDESTTMTTLQLVPYR